MPRKRSTFLSPPPLPVRRSLLDSRRSLVHNRMPRRSFKVQRVPLKLTGPFCFPSFCAVLFCRTVSIWINSDICIPCSFYGQVLLSLQSCFAIHSLFLFLLVEVMSSDEALGRDKSFNLVFLLRQAISESFMSGDRASRFPLIFIQVHICGCVSCYLDGESFALLGPFLVLLCRQTKQP